MLKTCILYPIVASSTDDNFTVDINVEPVPVPEMAYEPNPANGQGGVSTPITLRWKLGEYTSEYQLLMGTTYPPSEVIVDWTGDLAESYSTGTLLNNKNGRLMHVTQQVPQQVRCGDSPPR